MTKNTFLTVAWVLLLPIGAIALTLLRPLSLLPFDDGGFGRFHGRVEGSIEDHSRGISARFEGVSPPRWSWTEPQDYRYADVRLAWRDRESSGEGTLDLATLTLERDGLETVVDRDWFRRLLKNPALADESMGVLDDARKGGLPSPRDTPLSYPTGSLHKFLNHRSEGWILPYSVLVWVALWGAISALLLFRRVTAGRIILERDESCA